MDSINWTLIAVVVGAFVVGYAIVSFIGFIQGKLKSLKNTIPPDNQPPPNAGRSNNSDEKAEQSERQQQNVWQQEQERIKEEHRRQEKFREAQEQERLNEEKEHRNRQEEARRESSSRGSTRVKDEKYYGGILGLSGRVSFDDVQSRYRALVVQYHPDKVNHLGPKLKELAEREMKEINEAFGYFKRR